MLGQLFGANGAATSVNQTLSSPIMCILSHAAHCARARRQTAGCSTVMLLCTATPPCFVAIYGVNLAAVNAAQPAHPKCLLWFWPRYPEVYQCTFLECQARIAVARPTARRLDVTDCPITSTLTPPRPAKHAGMQICI